MKKIKYLFFFLFSFCFATANLIFTDYVTDQPNILTEHTKQELRRELASFEKSDSTQLFVVILNSIGNKPIEDYSYHLAQFNKIGTAKHNNGIMLLVAMKERPIRIEVGKGLEYKLTDALSGKIIDNIISPLFAQKKFDEGTLNGVNAIIKATRGEFVNQTNVDHDDKQASILILMGILLTGFIIDCNIHQQEQKLPELNRRPYGPFGYAPFVRVFNWFFFWMGLGFLFLGKTILEPINILIFLFFFFTVFLTLIALLKSLYACCFEPFNVERMISNNSEVDLKSNFDGRKNHPHKTTKSQGSSIKGTSGRGGSFGGGGASGRF